MTDQRPSSSVYDSPNYRSVLHSYWNNGTHQDENPDPIVDKARKQPLSKNNP